MKYLKIIYICLAFTFVSLNISGQDEKKENNSPSSEENGNPVLPQDSTLNNSSLNTINVAFNKINKEEKTGAIGIIKPDEFIGYDYSSSLYDGIIGRLQLWHNNGMLVLVDGVPRNLDDVRLEEVDQVTILKGANAVVLYGSYAANGVVLISTKR